MEEKIMNLLERAHWLVGNPGTNISSSTDLAAEQWQKDYDNLINELSNEKASVFNEIGNLYRITL